MESTPEAISTPARWSTRRWLLLFVVILAPSAYYAWMHRDQPDFGRNHDDAMYFLSAKSLADGNGYRIPSLPEDPYQTKYPPLFPALLTLIWKMNPNFPQNLFLASALNWTLLALCFLAIWALFRAWGLSEGRILALMVLLGVNSYFVHFGSLMFSDVLFTLLLIATFLAARRVGWMWAAAAGAIAGCAYLTRTSGMLLLISMPAWYLWRREKRGAAIFAAALLPFIAGWTLWYRAHMFPAQGFDLLYYVDYFGVERVNFGRDNMMTVISRNFGELLYSMGSPVVPITQLGAIAMISGIVRMFRRGVAVDYALFAAITSALLIPWAYSEERYVLPLFPLLVAGFVEEVTVLGGILLKAFRHPSRSHRAVAYAFASLGAIVVAAGLGLEISFSMFFWPRSTESMRTDTSSARAVFAWMNTNLAPDAKVLATSMDDGLIYAYTGRRGNFLPFLSRWWYSEDHQPLLDSYRDIVPYARSRGLDYVYFKRDSGFGIPFYRFSSGRSELAADIDRIVRENRELIPVFSSGRITLFRVAPRADQLASIH